MGAVRKSRQLLPFLALRKVLEIASKIPPDPVQPSPGSPAPAYRRRIILIKRALQMKYVLLVFVSVLLTVALVSLDVYYILGKIFLKELEDVNLTPQIVSATRLLFTHLSVYLLIVVLISVFISHRLAGPIFRLEKITESVASGDLSVRATLREGDELYETAESVNRMIESLREKILTEKTLSDRIEQKLTELSAHLRDGKISPREASALLDSIVLEVRHITSGFRLH